MSFSFDGSGNKLATTGFTLPTNNPPTTIADTSAANRFSGASGDSSFKPAVQFGATPFSSAPTFNFTSNQPSTAAKTTASNTTTSGPQFNLNAGSKPIVTSSIFTPIPSSSALSITTVVPAGTVASTTGSSATKISFGIPTSATTTSAPTSTVASSISVGITPISTTPTVTSSASLIPAASAGSLTFSQLEDSINKWTIDLEEQSKFFINQAKQLNAWDTLLIANGEKILTLNGSIERVKQQQQQLDQELDFVLAQQRELEELIAPLEKDLNELPVTDIDRNQMYQFSEIIDSQLKQMSDDLKEIIEHINESNKDDEVCNPVTQISRILNAHMNSLQWIDRNTAQLSGHLEQISKLQDSNRRNFGLNQSLSN